MIAFHLEWDAAGLARGARVEKRVNLALEDALPDSFEERLCLRERQAQMLDALVVFLQSGDISDGFFMAIIAAYDELEFDAHRRAPPGLHSG
jgi:hypothetical protein